MKKIFWRILDGVGVINAIYYQGDRPYKKYRGDAGFDLRSAYDYLIPPEKGMDIKVDTIATSRRMWFLLIGRSSTFHIKGLIVNTGIIDNGYCGKLGVYIYNPNQHAVKIEKGERISQIIPFNLIRNVRLVEGRLSVGKRGSNGFGSTGKK